MKSTTFVILILISYLNIFGQNIVTNPGFEQLDSCPTQFSPGYRFPFLSDWTCANWLKIPDNADLYHCCDSIWGYPGLCEGTAPYKLPPRTGEGYVGMFLFYPDTSIVDFSEYIQVKLSTPLEPSKLYNVSLFSYLSSAGYDHSSYANYIATNSLSVFFSNAQLNEDEWLLSDYTPQINFNDYIDNHWQWKQFKGSFVATGGEEFIIIGRFIPREFVEYYELPHDWDWTNRRSYIFIDDVAVWPADAPIYSADAGGNQFVCRTDQQRDSVTLGTHNLDEYLYTWFDADSNIVGNSGFLTVLPDTSTWYVLEVKDFKFDISHDTVWVYVIDCNDPLFIPNIFSPNGDGQNDVLYVRGQGIEQLTFTVYNRWGEQIFETHDQNQGWDGTYKGKLAPEAVYLYYIEAVMVDGKVLQKRGDVTVVR